MAATRNFDGIQHAEIRTTDFEATTIALHDQLEDCYYNFWRLGLSKPFRSYDVQATPALSKQLFDDLHGLIFHRRDIAFDNANTSRPRPQQIPKEDYPTREQAEAKITELRSRGIELT